MPEKSQLVAKCMNNGVPSSVQLRDHFSAVLGGAPYFKVEGLASVPYHGEGDGDPMLLFGIREVGADCQNFEHVAKLVGVPYSIAPDDSMTLAGDFKLVYEFNSQYSEKARFQVGLSSLEWDASRRRLHLLTSFKVESENGEDHVGADLWSLSLEDFRAGRSPHLVLDQEKGGAFEFQNKAEGVTVLPNGLLFVAYDPDSKVELDDQPRRKRRNNEAPYTLLALVDEEGNSEISNRDGIESIEMGMLYTGKPFWLARSISWTPTARPYCLALDCEADLSHPLKCDQYWLTL
jgi:hypothetical protein